MRSSTVPRNAYTDAPEQHPNLILGSLQLLFWLLVHPSAWRNHVARIDPTLRSDFCLLELTRAQWRQPALHKLLIQGYVVWPILIGCASGLILWILQFSGDQIAFGVAGGVAGGVALGVAVGMAGGVAVGMAGGVAFGVAGGLAGGVAVGGVTEGLDFMAFGVAGGVTGGVGLGVAGGVAVGVASLQNSYSLYRKIVGITVGVLIGGVTVGVTVGVAFGSAFGAMVGVAGGVAGGVAVGVAGGLRTSRWLWRSVVVSVVGGTAGGLAGGVTGSELFGAVGDVAYGVAGGVLYTTILTALFTLSYAVAERIAGSLAGGIAGALAICGYWIAFGFTSTVDLSQSIVLTFITFLATLFGLTLFLWRPIALYPIVAVWNAVLFYADDRRSKNAPSFLRYHSAFWDEFQRIPLLGLDEHVVLASDRNPAEAQAAIEYLSTRRQRWAAQAAQIELDARTLECCSDTSTIGHIYEGIAVGELQGPASSLFRSFSRISEDVNAALNQESTYNQRLALDNVCESLNGLLREFTRSSDKYTVRFRPIATHWYKTLTAKSEQLAQQSEQRQEIDSPYITGVPLTPQQSIFVGRTDISTQIEQLLLDRRRPPLLLYGQRRTGKTSLLLNLGRLLPNRIIPLFVDLQGPASSASDNAGFLYNLARAMRASANRWPRSLILPTLSRETLAVDPFTAFDEWLDEVEDKLGDNTALLALDEFERLDAAISQGRFSEADVLGMLRNLIQHRPRFKVLLSGAHTLQEFQRWSSYLINAQVVHIGYLKETEARKLIEHPVKDFALRYEPEASQRVLDVTRGHPFLVQLLCAEIVAYKNEQDPKIRRLATLADVNAAIPEALESGSMFFIDIEGNQVDSQAADVLQCLAASGKGHGLGIEDLEQQFPKHIKQTLVRLQQRELIENIQGTYCFQVELIRRWFDRSV